MARISSFFTSYLPFLALSAMLAGFIPLVGPSLHADLNQRPSITWQTLSLSAALIAFGFGYFWFQSKGPESRLKRALARPNLKLVVGVLGLAATAPWLAGFALHGEMTRLLSLVPIALLATMAVVWLVITAIEDIAGDSVPAYIENPRESPWVKKKEAYWTQNFRRTCFFAGGALGLASLGLWGAASFSRNAALSPELFEALDGAAVLCLFAAWVAGSFLRTPQHKE